MLILAQFSPLFPVNVYCHVMQPTLHGRIELHRLRITWIYADFSYYSKNSKLYASYLTLLMTNPFILSFLQSYNSNNSLCVEDHEQNSYNNDCQLREWSLLFLYTYTRNYIPLIITSKYLWKTADLKISNSFVYIISLNDHPQMAQVLMHGGTFYKRVLGTRPVVFTFFRVWLYLEHIKSNINAEIYICFFKSN